MLTPTGDILDILYQHSQFSRLVSLLKTINFAEAFQSDEIVTFFAPTNEVISLLLTHHQSLITSTALSVITLDCLYGVSTSDGNKTKMLRPRPRPIKQLQDYITKKLFCCNTHLCYQKNNFVQKTSKII